MMPTDDGRLYIVAGSSRCGKTTWVAREVARAARAFAWDPEDQWAHLPGWRRVTTRAALLAQAKQPGPRRVAYVSGGDPRAEFEFFAGCAYASGRHVAPCVVVAEELADVTTPSKAPPQWGVLLRRGLKRGITIYAISQRWSEADKTAMGNATDAVIFRQARNSDAEALGKAFGMSLLQINLLKPLQFVRKDLLTGAEAVGSITFKNKRQ